MTRAQQCIILFAYEYKACAIAIFFFPHRTKLSLTFVLQKEIIRNKVYQQEKSFGFNLIPHTHIVWEDLIPKLFFPRLYHFIWYTLYRCIFDYRLITVNSFSFKAIGALWSAKYRSMDIDLSHLLKFCIFCLFSSHWYQIWSWII